MSDVRNPVAVLPVQVARELNSYLSEQLPWLSLRPDFAKIEHRHLNWGACTDAQVEEFLACSPLAQHTHVAVLRSEGQPMEVFLIEAAKSRLDELLYPQEVAVVFAASCITGQCTVVKQCFVYAHSGRDLWAVGA